MCHILYQAVLCCMRIEKTHHPVSTILYQSASSVFLLKHLLKHLSPPPGYTRMFASSRVARAKRDVLVQVGILYSLYCTPTVLTILHSYCTHYTALLLYSLYCTHTVLVHCTPYTALILYSYTVLPILYSYCTHTLYSLYCTHTVLILYSLHCTHTVLTILYSYCTHTVLILYSLYCTHTVLTILYSYCTHYTVLILYSLYCTHTVLTRQW
jgi:hypothetical protein